MPDDPCDNKGARFGVGGHPLPRMIVGYRR
jgi:hypothetical protein